MGGNGPSGSVCRGSVNLAKLWLWVQPLLPETGERLLPDARWAGPGRATPRCHGGAQPASVLALAQPRGPALRRGTAWQRQDPLRDSSGTRCAAAASNTDGWPRVCQVELSGRCPGLTDVLVGSARELLHQNCCCCAVLRCWGFPGDALGDLWVSSKVFSFMILDE